MAAKTFRMVHNEAKEHCIHFINDLLADGSKEVVVRDAHTTKTLQQLGTLFGLWTTYITDQTGYTKDELHKEWKASFLRGIYIAEPIGDMQEMWVENLYALQEKQEWKKLHIHAKRISLSWATIKQMKQYMNEIQAYYIQHGYPLPIPDQFHRWYK